MLSLAKAAQEDEEFGSSGSSPMSESRSSSTLHSENSSSDYKEQSNDSDSGQDVDFEEDEDVSHTKDPNWRSKPRTSLKKWSLKLEEVFRILELSNHRILQSLKDDVFPYVEKYCPELMVPRELEKWRKRIYNSLKSSKTFKKGKKRGKTSTFCPIFEGYWYRVKAAAGSNKEKLQKEQQMQEIERSHSENQSGTQDVVTAAIQTLINPQVAPTIPRVSTQNVLPEPAMLLPKLPSIRDYLKTLEEEERTRNLTNARNLFQFAQSRFTMIPTLNVKI